ncbi:hypothetical protein [Campylobacter sp. RM16704]|uniref:hypothetical protein n=1 Tax=Campylobacter sp. RM16704 TaxID=1500960 RepID=UPI000B108E67|nr:hypothetical protein [Campylobacter sp. RM16704]
MKRFYILFFSVLFFAPSLLFGATNIDDDHIIFTWGYGEVVNEFYKSQKMFYLFYAFIFASIN